MNSLGMRTLFILSILVALSLLGCSKKPSVAIGKVLIDSALSSDGVTVEKQALRQAVYEQLKEMRLQRFEKTGKGILKVRAVAGRIPPGPTGLPVVALNVVLKTRGQTGEFKSFEANSEERGVSALDHPDSLGEKAIDSALTSIEQQIELVFLSTENLIAAVKKEERTELRDRAISTLAQRKDPKAFPVLVELLEEENTDVVLKAVGALVALGDPRAVRTLTDLTHRKGPSFVRQIVYAVGSIGGREAEAYLFTVANGHPDVSVQQAAKEAMAELNERKEIR